MVELRSVSFGYQSDRMVLDNLSLRLEEGRWYGLLGMNGSGKTTLLKLIAGKLFAQSGEIDADVFPLFRPFVLGLCIMFFPTMVLGTINGILSPVCSATSSLVEQQTFDMKKYQEEKDELENL